MSSKTNANSTCWSIVTGGKPGWMPRWRIDFISRPLVQLRAVHTTRFLELMSESRPRILSLTAMSRRIFSPACGCEAKDDRHEEARSLPDAIRQGNGTMRRLKAMDGPERWRNMRTLDRGWERRWIESETHEKRPWLHTLVLRPAARVGEMLRQQTRGADSGGGSKSSRSGSLRDAHHLWPRRC